MKVTVDAVLLKQALKRLQPSRKYKSMQESLVTATAGGSALVIMGTLESSASVQADVHDAGSTPIPLDSSIRLLGTYKKGAAVVIRTEPGVVFFDKLKLNVS